MRNFKQIKFVAMSIAMILVTCLLSDLEIDFKPDNVIAATRTLTKSQQKNADRIAEVAAENWDTYGVLPSVAVAQAFIESTLGDHCSGNNLWGIKSGAVSYSSLDEGIIAYLKVINNGYYKGAPGCKNYKTQLSRILDGGYCKPVGNYYSNATWAIDAYDFDKYDKAMFREIKKKKEEARKQRIFEREAKERKAKWTAPYTIVYDESVPSHAVSVDSSIIKKGTVSIWEDNMMQGIYDVQGGQTGYTIGTRDLTLVGKTVFIEVNEDAVG